MRRERSVEKIPVAILGATGIVGQKFVELLSYHPWFKIAALAASERSVGKRYREAMRWMMSTPLSEEVGQLLIQPCFPEFPCKLLFSGLDAAVAGSLEESCAKAGYWVISNSRNHRMDPQVPLLIPEVNSAHLELLSSQRFGSGKLLTNPNCSVIGLTLALKPLLDRWGVEAAHVVTMQALSGAGYPGVPGLDILGNVIPYIEGEEEKIEQEPLKILGTFTPSGILPATVKLSAQCNRVSVADGHMACVSLKLKKKAKHAEIIEAWRSFKADQLISELPLAPSTPLIYCEEREYPQPRVHASLNKGMSVALGRLRPCPLFDWKFTLLSHNTVRGGAGCALLNAELLFKLNQL